MKQILSVVIAISLITISCSKKQAPTLQLSPHSWDETNKYQIYLDTALVGTHRLIYRSLSEPEPLIELQSISEIKHATAISRDSTILLLRQHNLKPIFSSKTLLTGGALMTSEVKYNNNKATIKAHLPHGEKSIDIPINANTYDNDQITTILRAINLNSNEEKEITVVIGLSGTTIPMKIKLVGDEKVKVPAGEFECHKYLLSFLGREVYIWYEKTSAIRMIKYFDSTMKMTMELL
ncbi:MAG: DUF3108 domain-containing protein [candidate division WOR-3 bacterium]